MRSSSARTTARRRSTGWPAWRTPSRPRRLHGSKNRGSRRATSSSPPPTARAWSTRCASSGARAGRAARRLAGSTSSSSSRTARRSRGERGGRLASPRGTGAGAWLATRSVLDGRGTRTRTNEAGARWPVPTPGDVIVSAAAGWEFEDLGRRHHGGGGSHGSLLAGDSTIPILRAGFEAERAACGAERDRPRSARSRALRDRSAGAAMRGRVASRV